MYLVKVLSSRKKKRIKVGKLRNRRFRIHLSDSLLKGSNTVLSSENNRESKM